DRVKSAVLSFPVRAVGLPARRPARPSGPQTATYDLMSTRALRQSVPPTFQTVAWKEPPLVSEPPATTPAGLMARATLPMLPPATPDGLMPSAWLKLPPGSIPSSMAVYPRSRLRFQTVALDCPRLLFDWPTTIPAGLMPLAPLKEPPGCRVPRSVIV